MTNLILPLVRSLRSLFTFLLKLYFSLQKNIFSLNEAVGFAS
ncbi:hypothetical protein [Scytonema sp. UIC 10036]|nr:hypothetical protein [Scytonema sp. UIC 10036]